MLKDEQNLLHNGVEDAIPLKHDHSFQPYSKLKTILICIFKVGPTPNMF